MALIRKTAKYAENVTFLEKHIKDIEDNSDKIVQQWLNHDDIVSLFLRLKIDRDDFKENYAYKILDHYISVVKKEEEIGSCPIITSFLRFYSNKEIDSSDLYTIYIHLRESTINNFFNLNIMNSELYSNLSYVFDKNLEGILSQLGNTIFQIEQEVQEYKQVFNQYNVALDQSALVSKTDTKGIITYVNPNFVKVSGYSEDELLGNSHNIIRHPDMTKDFFENLWDTIKRGDTFRGNIKNRKKDGSEYYVDTTILPLYDIDKNIKEFLSVRYEVTDLIRARDIAIEAEKSKDIFLANMSHEIRTPLNAILGFIDILRKKISDKEQKQYLETINSSSQSLLTIISDILDFAKLRNGKFDINLQEFNLLKELRIIVNLFSKNASKKDIDYIFSIDSKLPKNIYADSVRINQILSNILSNAIKFTPESGTVKISVLVKDGRLRVSVSDTGDGMDEEQQSRIFHAFEQAEKTTTKKHGGTGLGLAISLKLANYMGGDITLKSSPGQGSIFTLDIPVEYDKNSLVDVLVNDEYISSDTTVENVHKFNGHILVVEDNKANQMLIRILLEEFGLSLDIANDGKEAYEMYESNQISNDRSYDLILMDNQMPVMNGIDSAYKIREIAKENNFDKIPIVALTANALKGDREYFLNNGLDDYIKKPIDIKDLERVLKERISLVN